MMPKYKEAARGEMMPSGRSRFRIKVFNETALNC